MSRPSSSAPPSPMKIRAGWKLCGRKPRQMPQHDDGDERARVVGADARPPSSSVAVEEERPGGDGDDAGGQPVEPVDEVDGVGHAEHPQHREQRRPVGREHDDAGERDAEEQHADARAGTARCRPAPCRRSWPAPTPRAGRRRCRPRTDQHRGREHGRAASERAVEHRRRSRAVARPPPSADEEADQHGHARRAWADRHGVHPALVGLRHHAAAGRRAAARSGVVHERDDERRPRSTGRGRTTSRHQVRDRSRTGGATGLGVTPC